MEDNEYGWWHLSRTDTKVATLSRNIEYAGDNSYEHIYACTFEWLMMDETDSDGDGIPDFMETQGIVGTNGKIYYSDPNVADTDGDGLTDGEEFGQITGFYSYYGNNISFRLNGELSSENSIWCNAEEGFFSRIVSIPTLKNSDADDLEDGEDSYRLITKQDVIYILYQDDNDLNEGDAKIYYKTYKANGLNCIIRSFNGIDSFICTWDAIGRRYISSGIYTDDDYYNVTDVVISAHGDTNEHILYLTELNNGIPTDFLVPNNYSNEAVLGNNNCIRVNELSDKKIDNLHLRVCSLADIYPVLNSDIPSDFLMSFNRINRVYAFDSDMGVLNPSNCVYSLVGLLDITEHRDSFLDYINYRLSLFILGSYGQIIYHRGMDCEGIVGIGGRQYGDSYISYDNLYEGDLICTYTENETIYPLDTASYYFDPILEN